MSVLTKFSHLRAVNPLDWRTLVNTLLRIYPDYYSGQGISHSLNNVTLELTYRCNWQCKFCYLKDNKLNRKVDELTYNEIVEIIDQVAPYRLSFFLSGGEPFVRRDCIDIIRAIKERGLKVGVNTNSQRLDPQSLDQLREIGLDYLISSIHGPKEVHDKITGVRSFDQVIDNFRYWNSRPRRTRLFINYVITPETAQHMKSMIEVAASVGADAIIFQHQTFLTEKDLVDHQTHWREVYGEAYDLELSYLNFDPADIDRERLTHHIQAATRRADELSLSCFFMPDLTEQDRENWYGDGFRSKSRCSYIYTNVRVSPCGDVIPCQFIPKVIGNVRHSPLLEIVNNAEMVRFRKGIQTAGGLFGACARCCKLQQGL